MKHQLFSVFDTKAQAFLPPFALHAAGMAKRAFADCVNDPKHNFGRHPSDYTLFRLGEFDDDTGALRAAKESLGNGVEFINIEIGHGDLFTDDNTQQLATLTQ